MKVLQGDSLLLLKEMEDNSIDAVVTDPPYGLGKEPDAVKVLQDWITIGHHEVSGKGFMGKEWDSFVPQPAFWKEVLRVLKPGGHALVFAGTRTVDWMGMSLRLAGFEVRDELMWMYGSGFPKSMNLGKSIDKKFGAEREVVGIKKTKNQVNIKGGNFTVTDGNPIMENLPITAPATDEAKKYDGWGTALKPAHEPILLVRKPFKGSTTNNVLEHGTGGLNIDACRVETEDKYQINTFDDGAKPFGDAVGEDFTSRTETKGRWPANIIHDGSQGVLELFPETKSGSHKKGLYNSRSSNSMSGELGEYHQDVHTASEGSASRYFYCAKASKKEKNAGLGALPKKQKVFNGKSGESSEDMKDVEKRFTTQPTANIHPTVKPIALMKHLVQLVTPVDGIVLDPFAGSGTTGVAAKELGYDFILMERDEEYIPIIEGRLKV